MACLAMLFWKWAFTPQKVSCCLASWHGRCRGKASIVAMVVKDLESVFSCILFKWELGGKCFVIKLEMEKMEVAIVVNEDGGAHIAFLGEFVFQLCIKSHLR